MLIARVSVFITLETRKLHKNIQEKISKHDINKFNGLIFFKLL